MRTIPFSPPDITEKEVEAVSQVLCSGWITTGPKTKEFEKKIADFCNTKTAVCLSSQTSCAEITLRILGIGKGDEVIVPSYTYTATASVIYHVGATPVMIDCAKDSFEMDYDKVAEAITGKTKVIIPVDIAGVMCDYDRLFKIVEKKKYMFKANSPIQSAFNRIIVMADGAHSFGAMRNGKHSGEVADFTNFSFHAVKNMTTAEGGAVTWRPRPDINDADLYKKYMLMTLHGQTKDALAKSKGTSWEYDVTDALYKCNMTDMQGALGLAQLERYPAMLERRHSMVDTYNEAFQDMNIAVLNHHDENSRSSAHLYFVRFIGKDNAFRNAFYNEMADRGISCNVHFKPLPMLTAYKNKGFNIKDFPMAYDMHKNQLTLPMNTVMTDDDVKYVIENFKEVYEKLIKRF